MPRAETKINSSNREKFYYYKGLKRNSFRRPKVRIFLTNQVKLNININIDPGDKLAKNRESARNSRKRKKIYLELLENKVTKLSEQLESSKKVYEKN
jgi:hypothetical protein